MKENSLNNLTKIIQNCISKEQEIPVLKYKTPTELKDDLTIPQKGRDDEGFFKVLEDVVRYTPKTASRKFFNQLFGGRMEPAVLADMLVPFLNNSMYTYKVGGIQVLIEQEVIRKMCLHVGFPYGDGTFAPGGSLSNLVAMIIGRNEKKSTIKDKGLDGSNYIVYTSDQAHYSITKNANIIGIGKENVCKVESNNLGKMDLNALRRAIEGDLTTGNIPFFINATAGTTVLGVYDAIEKIHPVAQKYGIWLHIDGAFGGTALLSKTHKHLLDGCQKADSFTWDAHKMMGVPLIGSTILVKRSGLLSKHFNENAGYLFQTEEEYYNPGTRSIQCGRRNDALKIWAAWQYLGDEGYETRVNRQFELAQYATTKIKKNEKFRLLMEPESLNVCFEVIGRSSEKICEELDKQSLAKIGHGTFKGKTFIRLVTVNPDLTHQDIDACLEDILSV